MEIDRLAETLHPLERKVLPVLDKVSSFEDILEKTKLKDIEVMRALQWLQNKGIIKLHEEVKQVISLDKNGIEYKENSLPEIRFLKAIKGEMSVEDIQKIAKIDKSEVNICIGTLKGKAAINIKKDKGLIISATPQAEKILKTPTFEEKFLSKDFPIDLHSLEPEEKFAFDNLRKRKNILSVDIIKIKTVELTPLGKKMVKLSPADLDTVDRLTPELIKSGKWKKSKFRRYDVKINVPKIHAGKRHFVKQTIDYIKKIWLEMGFKEMSGNLLATSFWDLDSLFVPQDHPARQMQDTFYIQGSKGIKSGKLPDMYKKVKEVHENGGKTGSTGWQSKWDETLAKEVLMRTHTTVLSALTIANLKKEDLPAKYFAVGRVFRNEALDWKHLFEFNQVEGIVIDENANLRHLIGYLKQFYKKMGYKDVRVRPGHFPYTEPSLEVEALHPVKNEWVELGGAGIFRPEVVVPLLGKDIPVLAWGQGLGRIIMPYYDLTDIRDLYKNDLKQLRELKIFLR